MQDLYLVVPPGSADLVIARDALQWVPLSEHPQCFTTAYTVLRPWWLAAHRVRRCRQPSPDHGGSGRARGRLRPAARLTFPDAGMAYDLVVAAGFTVPVGGVQTVAQRRAFDRDQLL